MADIAKDALWGTSVPCLTRTDALFLRNAGKHGVGTERNKKRIGLPQEWGEQAEKNETVRLDSHDRDACLLLHLDYPAASVRVGRRCMRVLSFNR
jgi:hypothetical protein